MQQLQQLLADPLVLFLLLLWVMPWKGIALWKSSQNGQKIWFVALFVVNTLALLDIAYIFFFSKKKQA